MGEHTITIAEVGECFNCNMDTARELFQIANDAGCICFAIQDSLRDGRSQNAQAIYKAAADAFKVTKAERRRRYSLRAQISYDCQCQSGFLWLRTIFNKWAPSDG